MKLWTRVAVSFLALAFAVGLAASPADAASKKSKKETKKESKKEVKKETRHETRHSSGSKRFITGTNTIGRAGLFFGDTSDVAAVGQVEGSAHLTYWSFGPSGYATTDIGLPVGAHFGVAKNLDLSGAIILNFISVPSVTVPGFGTVGGGSTTNFALDLGGKYRIAGGSKSPDFSIGGDIMVPTQTGGQVIVSPRGVVSYTLESGLLLNGDVAINISSATYASFDGGVGVPVGSNLSIIGEIGANQSGNGGSMLGGGVRADLSGIKLQGLLGIPLNGGGVQLGGGIVLASN